MDIFGVSCGLVEREFSAVSKPVNMGEFSFPHLQNGHNNIYLIEILGELDIIMNTIKIQCFENVKCLYNSYGNEITQNFLPKILNLVHLPHWINVKYFIVA